MVDKKKTKELELEKELDKMFFIKMGKLKGFAKPIWDWEKPKLVNLINALLTQQRTELLEEILNLECLKDEEYELGWSYPRNQLREEIIGEIKKL